MNIIGIGFTSESKMIFLVDKKLEIPILKLNMQLFAEFVLGDEDCGHK